MFYTDLPHRVTSVTSGLRVTLTFKVYAKKTIDEDSPTHKKRKLHDDDSSDDDDDNHEEVEEEDDDEKDESSVERLFELARQNKHNAIGIIMSHDYTISSNFLKGKDELLKRLLGPSATLTLIPIQVSEDEDIPVEETGTYSSDVYPMSEAHLEYILDKRDTPTEELFCHNIPFFNFQSGYSWSEESIESCEYTGNESQDGSKSSLSLSMALIIHGF